jgi:hypothetical protein
MVGAVMLIPKERNGMKPTLLSVKEIALVMGVSTQSIRRSYWKGHIRAFRVCKVLRFDLEHVRQTFLANGLPASRAGQKPGATGGDSRRRAGTISPRSVKRGRNFQKRTRRRA